MSETVERNIKRHLPNDAIILSTEIIGHPFINKKGARCLRRSVSVKYIHNGSEFKALLPYRPKEMK
jgi:hypothetical protein